MRRSYTKLYLHIIWATWDRMDLIDPEIEPVLYNYIRNKCEENRCWLETIGGTSNHLHILVRFTTSISIGKLVHQIKGASSHYIAQIYRPDDFFKWQGGYSAFTVSPFQVNSIITYIENQKQHHYAQTQRMDWEYLPPPSNRKYLFFPFSPPDD